LIPDHSLGDSSESDHEDSLLNHNVHQPNHPQMPPQTSGRNLSSKNVSEGREFEDPPPTVLTENQTTKCVDVD
jgi:hypothetical protein